jgi:hypothetical protein
VKLSQSELQSHIKERPALSNQNHAATIHLLMP